MSDVHQHTVETDEAFHKLMDSIHGEKWHSWSYERKRMAAKAFNFGKFYSADSNTLRRALENRYDE